MDHLVSVLVPVYNAETYIKECLESIQEQTFKDFEVICIDDGSTDRSGKICDEYAEEDSRFRVYHQRNSGVAVARENALQKATGKYIFWCDADDRVNPIWLEKVVYEFKNTNADIIHFATQRIGNREKFTPDIWQKSSLPKMQEAVLLGKSNGACLWAFATKRELWVNECIPKEFAQSAEDGYLAIRIYMKAKEISVLSDVLYYHLTDSAYSLSHVVTGKRYLGQFALWNYRLIQCLKYFPDKERDCVQHVLSNGVKAICLSLVQNDLSDNEKEGIRETLHNIKAISTRKYRDAFLKWCIIHGYWGICRCYALRKIKKAQRENKEIERNRVKH